MCIEQTSKWCYWLSIQWWQSAWHHFNVNLKWNTSRMLIDHYHSSMITAFCTAVISTCSNINCWCSLRHLHLHYLSINITTTHACHCVHVLDLWLIHCQHNLSTSITIFILLLLLDHINQTFRKSHCQQQFSHFSDLMHTYKTGCVNS